MVLASRPQVTQYLTQLKCITLPQFVFGFFLPTIQQKLFGHETTTRSLKGQSVTCLQEKGETKPGFTTLNVSMLRPIGSPRNESDVFQIDHGNSNM